MDFQEFQERLRRALEAFRAEPEPHSVIGIDERARQRQAGHLREDALYADIERQHGDRDTAAERIPEQRRWEAFERPALLRELAHAEINDETRDLVEAAAAWLLADARRRRET